MSACVAPRGRALCVCVCCACCALHTQLGPMAAPDTSSPNTGNLLHHPSKGTEVPISAPLPPSQPAVGFCLSNAIWDSAQVIITRKKI